MDVGPQTTTAGCARRELLTALRYASTGVKMTPMQHQLMLGLDSRPAR